MERRGLIACTLFCLLAPALASAETGQSHWPAKAKVYFVSPKNGDVITRPVKVVMGAKGIDIAPAGTDKAATGHHHILVDVALPQGEQAQAPLPMDDHVIRFPVDQFGLAGFGHQWNPARPLTIAGWLARVTHWLATIASSSSIVPMCLLTTGSSTRTHSVSAGCSSGE